MTNPVLPERIAQMFPNAEVSKGVDFVCLTVNKEQAFGVLETLRKSDEWEFDYLFCLTAVDRMDYFEIVYHIASTSQKHELVVKTRTENRENAQVDSVISLWKSAELFECEVFDLFGIQFKNHTCRRLFLPDDWQGHPLRKDYVDEVNMIKL